ncbi:uncharacterized protein LOC143341838 isoform X3 [Colletes latitarsis]|uniref:uncharacterized protein LOC143341838 isoform X3 n=2 Tax=Colletes latitarsis TaxID=2605962 RepID=UPI00403576A3
MENRVILNMENEGSPSVAGPKPQKGVTGWTFSSILESGVVTASQSFVGQALFKLVDSFLWVVEKSAQWSLPAQEINAEENGKVFGKIQLVRPLPWILFLPSLVMLRIVRAGLNVGAFVLGYPKIQSSGVVKFVQKSRRRLRALNLKAVKSARRKMSNKDKRLTMIEAKKALIRSIRLTLSTLSCLDTSKSSPSPSPPPTKIRITGMDLETAATPDEKSTTESAGSPMHAEIKRKYSQVSSDEESSDDSENETLQARLDKIALHDTSDNSSDDSDFNPGECVTDSSTSSNENEVDKNVSLTEVLDVQKECEEIKNSFEEKPAPLTLDKLQEAIAKSTEETESSIGRVDSSESKLQTTSRTTIDFINGEVNSTLPPMPTAPAPTPEVTNGVVTEHKGSNRKSSNAPSQPRGFNARDHAPGNQEKKSNSRKKPGRRDAK